jgi:thiosulfate dehydrogenase [quinone] large subunit
MNLATLTGPKRGRAALRDAPIRSLAIGTFLIGRYGYAAFFAYGFWQKLTAGWLWSDALKQHFMRRLGETDIAAFQAAYLEHFAIPMYLPIAWVVTLGELVVAIGLILGVATRASAFLALFILVNFAAGGYYNPGLLLFIAYAALMVALPSGHWLGLDRQLSQRYPDSLWFR